MNKQLTKNFNLKEFSSQDLNDYQIALLQILSSNMQIVRDKLQEYCVKGKSVCINIISGVRTQADYDRIKANGNNPSKTSDHFCGLQLLAKPTLGAADVRISNCTLSLKQIASKIIEWNKQVLVNFGQVIYEYNPNTKSEWIHLGNSPKQIFKDVVSNAIVRNKYLMSLDNGKTYITFKL